MEGFIWLNDCLIEAERARISPFDRGFLYGDGLFETFRVEGGRSMLLERHLRRLYNSAEIIGLENLPEPDWWRGAIAEVISANEWVDSRLRITLSRGVGGEPTRMIHGRPLLQNELLPEPINVAVSSYLRSPSPFPVRLKSLNYLAEILAFERAQRAGATDALFLTEDGYVAEGSVSNIFCVHSGRLWTPPVSLGILPGILRGLLLEICSEEGIIVIEDRFPLQMLKDADEVFATNSVRQIIPVKSVAGEAIRGEVPGKWTRELRELLQNYVVERQL